MSHKRHRKKKPAHTPKKPRRCEGCGEDDLKVVPVVVHVGGRRVARWALCRPCSAGVVHAVNPWVKKS